MATEVMSGTAVLLRVARVLQALHVPFHLGGSYASSIHGVPRQTRDADLIAELGEEHVSALVGALGRDFYVDETAIRRAIRLRASFNAIHLASGFKVDVFVPQDRAWDREVQARSVLIALCEEPGSEIPVKSPEDVILAKLEWYRMGGGASERQWSDALGVAKAQAKRLDRGYLLDRATTLRLRELLEKLLGEV